MEGSVEELLAEYVDVLWEVKKKCTGGQKRGKSPQLKELTITPSIIVLGSHDIIPTLYGGYVWW